MRRGAIFDLSRSSGSPEVAALKETGFVKKLAALMMEAGQGGVHPEIVAAHLAYAHKLKTGRPIE